MHDGPHDDPHGHLHGYPHAHPHPHSHGHNAPRAATQWQTPHLPAGEAEPAPQPERDLDLVEASFVEGFGQCSDPTSFLRLAGIAFSGTDAAGRRLHLLRVEIEDLTDVGTASPLLGGEGLHYDPLPARLVSRRRRLGFAYHDGTQVVRLDFAAARRLV
ncbi:MAG: hypothetical protein WDN25_08890 [Acetobacteraceae bacterium]